MINVRIRNGLCPDPSTGEGGATEGDIRGSFSDIIDVVGVKDLAGGHALVTENSPAAMSVLVAPGIVYIPNADYDELDSDSVKFWEAIITVSTEVAITANTSGSARIDLICAKMDTTITPDKHASNIATLVAVAGTPGAGAPTLPDNYAKLAEVEVANGASTIVNADITDSRVQSKINSDYIPLNLPSGIILSSPLFSGSLNGWINPNETWEYVSVDDPTGIFRVNADVTGKYSAGMRIKFTNGGNTIYGIITVVNAYEADAAGYTYIKFLHEIDPTDSLALYLMANSAITANYYSSQKVPQGFPLSLNKWTIELNTATVSEVSVAQNVWTNIGSINIVIPIGSYKVSYSTLNSYALKTSSTCVYVKSTISTANNSESDVDFTYSSGIDAGSATLTTIFSAFREKVLNLTTKTTYYLNFSPQATDNTLISNGEKTIIKAICAYL